MRKLLLLFVVLLVLLSWAGWAYRVRIASDALTHGLGVPTEVSDVEVSTHGLVLRGVSLGTSKKPSQSPALKVDTVRITFSPWRIWDNPMHIQELDLDNVYVILDSTSWDGFSKNWSTVFQKLAQKVTDSQHPSKGDSSHEDEEERRYVLDRVVVTNIHVSMENRKIPALAGSASAVVRLELHDVGAQTPRSLQKTVQLLLGAILEQAAAPHPQLSNFADGVLRNADEELKNVIKTIKDQYHEHKENGMWQKVRSYFDWGS